MFIGLPRDGRASMRLSCLGHCSRRGRGARRCFQRRSSLMLWAELVLTREIAGSPINLLPYTFWRGDANILVLFFGESITLSMLRTEKLKEQLRCITRLRAIRALM